MRKIRSKIVALIAVVVAACAALACLAACSGGAEKDIEGYYTRGYAETYNSVDNLTLYSDGTFELVQTNISVGGDSIYVTDCITTYGDYTQADPADGYIKLDLAAATRVIFSRVVMSGMFYKVIDSETSEFPVTYIGDDVTQISKEQFMSEYGAAKTYYIVLDGNDAETNMIVTEMA